jgi:hypothetical protein
MSESELRKSFARIEEAARAWFATWEQLFAEAEDDPEETAELELTYRRQMEIVEAHQERLRAVGRAFGTASPDNADTGSQ